MYQVGLDIEDSLGETPMENGGGVSRNSDRRAGLQCRLTYEESQEGENDWLGGVSGYSIVLRTFEAQAL